MLHVCVTLLCLTVSALPGPGLPWASAGWSAMPTWGKQWRVVTNPMTLNSAWRLEEIPLEIDADVIALQGIRWNASRYTPYNKFEFKVGEKVWTAILWGYCNAQPGSNSHAGFLLGPRASRLNIVSDRVALVHSAGEAECLTQFP